MKPKLLSGWYWRRLLKDFWWEYFKAPYVLLLFRLAQRSSVHYTRAIDAMHKVGLYYRNGEVYVMDYDSEAQAGRMWNNMTTEQQDTCRKTWATQRKAKV